MNRPTPRRLGLAVGDCVERVFAQALSLPPGDRPRDLGHFWGMLKNAMRMDVESGRPPHAELPLPSHASYGATLRMQRRADPVRPPVAAEPLAGPDSGPSEPRRPEPPGRRAIAGLQGPVLRIAIGVVLAIAAMGAGALFWHTYARTPDRPSIVHP
jgi:hypothetical protein